MTQSNAQTEVRSTFNYTKDVDKLTELYFYETPDADGIHEPGDDPHEMAVTDGWHVTSSPDEDFFKLYLRYRDRNGENYVMRHSKNHKWWYFPKMTPEQVVLLKTYESETDGRARFVGHTAFEDPTSPPDAPFRESVEIRTMAFF